MRPALWPRAAHSLTPPDLPTTLNELGRVTHVAEVVNHTGLGTASALLSGGFNLVAEPGAPGIGLVDKLFLPEHHSIICAYLGPTPTREALAKLGIASQVNEPARRAMEAIKRTPDLATFLREARRFGAETGFESANVSRIISVMMSAGAIGAAQNMIGEAVHAVAADSKVTRIVAAVRREFPAAKVFADAIRRPRSSTCEKESKALNPLLKTFGAALHSG